MRRIVAHHSLSGTCLLWRVRGPRNHGLINLGMTHLWAGMRVFNVKGMRLNVIRIGRIINWIY